MTYLLAKYSLLFLLASVLGFVLGYWWSRRNLVDVSESYEDLRKSAQRTDDANWERLWTRLDALPEPKETDLSGVLERLERVSNSVAAIPKPETGDLDPVAQRLESLAGRIDSIPVPVPPKAPDLGPVLGRIEKLEHAIRELPAPADVGPLRKRMDDIDSLIRSIPTQLPHKDVDLEPLQSELASVRTELRNLPKVETLAPVDIDPVLRRIDALEQRVGSIPQPEKVDLEPLDMRLRSIESEIGRLGKEMSRSRHSTPRLQARPPSRAKARRAEPTILSAAIYGKKDDLKLISGVGPKLEQLLNRNGVYYFWQIASWSRQDIDAIDKRLDAFKGRIARDRWVAQAQKLGRLPEAARMPTT